MTLGGRKEGEGEKVEEEEEEEVEEGEKEKRGRGGRRWMGETGCWVALEILKKVDLSPHTDSSQLLSLPSLI